jgi:hypothetical protein
VRKDDADHLIKVVSVRARHFGADPVSEHMLVDEHDAKVISL